MPIVLAHASELCSKSLKNTDFTPHSGTFYVALFSATPAANGSGGTEVTGTGYARQTITWGTESNGAVKNTNTITFTASAADWTTATHFVIFSAVTAGTRYFWNALDSSVAVGNGESASFAADALEVDFLPGVA